MESSYRINLRNSQTKQMEKNEPLRGSQLSLLGLNDLTRSFIGSTDSKSERTPNKLNYKYQRVNNSFRLVQIDHNDSENKENVQETSKMNAHVLMTLNSLSERMEKLEKSQKFDEQKQQFYVHKIVEKMVSENRDSKYFHAIEKKLEHASYDINDIKSKISELSALSNQLGENHEKLVMKCKLIEDQLSPDLFRICRDQYNQLQLRLNQSQNEARACLMKAVKTMEKELQRKSEQILSKHSRFEVKWEQNRESIEVDIESIRSALRDALGRLEGQLVEQKTKCIDKIMGVISFGLKTWTSLEETNRQSKGGELMQLTKYGIDSDGQLVDSEGFYLVDKKGQIIKLTFEQVKKLEDLNILIKKKQAI